MRKQNWIQGNNREHSSMTTTKDESFGKWKMWIMKRENGKSLKIFNFRMLSFPVFFSLFVLNLKNVRKQKWQKYNWKKIGFSSFNFKSRNERREFLLFLRNWKQFLTICVGIHNEINHSENQGRLMAFPSHFCVIIGKVELQLVKRLSQHSIGETLKYLRNTHTHTHKSRWHT